MEVLYMKKYDDLKVRHTIRVDTELSDFLCELSSNLDVSVSECIRMILSSTMANWKRLNNENKKTHSDN